MGAMPSPVIVGVGESVGDGTGVSVGAGVSVGVDESEGETVGVGVGLAVGVTDALGVTVGPPIPPLQVIATRTNNATIKITITPTTPRNHVR